MGSCKECSPSIYYKFFEKLGDEGEASGRAAEAVGQRAHGAQRIVRSKPCRSPSELTRSA